MKKSIPRSSDQPKAVYKKSAVLERKVRGIESFEQPAEQQRQERVAVAKIAAKEKNYTLPYHKQVWACTRRQLLRCGDKKSLRGKWGTILSQAPIIGSLFFDMPKTWSEVFERGDLIAFILLFNPMLVSASSPHSDHAHGYAHGPMHKEVAIAVFGLSHH